MSRFFTTLGCAVGLFACTGQLSTEPATDATDEAPLFIAVPKDGPAVTGDTVGDLGEAQAALEIGPTSFYIALHRRALAERWFFSAYLKEYFPNPYGPYTLGTRVVTFRLQNGRLFVFDVDERKQTSDVFDPEVLVDAYPVVTDFAPFERLPGAEDYVLIDPADGLNRFGLVGDDPDAAFAKLSIELAFTQNVQVLDDGAHYELVFTGFMDNLNVDGPSFNGVETNPFRASGTVGVAIRRYREGDGYEALDLPKGSHYFSADPYLVTNEGYARQRAARWNIRPGSEPVEWLISREILDLQADPRFDGADLVAAVRQAVEGWNDAFGFEALRARVAEPHESFADDSLNFIVMDTDQGKGYAFANWRTNPNSGEIRGASVYMGGFWTGDNYLNGLRPEPEHGGDDAGDAPAPPAASPPMLSWGPLHPARLCDREIVAPTAAREDDGRSLREKLEPYLTHFIAHEIGHTLGLRHNFKGSLMPPSSSVMDYLGFEDSAATPGPQAYDIDAVRHLYGLADDGPQQPFCTDGDVCSYGPCDPTCERHDRGESPLREAAIPEFERAVERALSRGVDRRFDYGCEELLDFIRFGSEDDVAAAWAAMEAAIRGRLAEADAEATGRIDDMARRLFERMYLKGGPYHFLDLPAYFPGTQAVREAVQAELRLSLLNADGARSYATRRTTVDALKAIQTTEALQALIEARGAIEAQLATMDAASDRHQAHDLLARMDAAMAPYFD